MIVAIETICPSVAAARRNFAEGNGEGEQWLPPHHRTLARAQMNRNSKDFSNVSTNLWSARTSVAWQVKGDRESVKSFFKFVGYQALHFLEAVGCSLLSCFVLSHPVVCVRVYTFARLSLVRMLCRRGTAYTY